MNAAPLLFCLFLKLLFGDAFYQAAGNTDQKILLDDLSCAHALA